MEQLEAELSAIFEVRRYCATIAPLLHRYCTAIAHLLHRYCTSIA